MRFRSTTAARPFHNMWAFFDVALLLLIFSQLTLRIVDPEGVHEITVQASEPQVDGQDIRCFEPLQVKLKSTNDGSLAEVLLEAHQLGAGREGLEELGRYIQILCAEAGPDLASGLEVVIEADSSLQYQYTIQAIGQCSMERTADGQLVPLGPKVRLATWNTIKP